MFVRDGWTRGFGCRGRLGLRAFRQASWREVRLRITGPKGNELFAGETSTGKMKRAPRELAEWLVRDNPVPPGSVLLTGTGLVPPDDYTLEAGHVVEITIDGIGVLSNSVAA